MSSLGNNIKVIKRNISFTQFKMFVPLKLKISKTDVNYSRVSIVIKDIY